MTQQPENTDPIASAGQIDDPDQPTTVKGQDDSRAGRDTQPDESSADGDPDQPGAARHSARPSGHDDAARAASTAPGATAPTTSTDATREDLTRHDGKPPKAIQETGVPVVDRETAQARDVRDVDSEALAGTRKFQPRPGDANPNVSDSPADFPDHQAADHRTAGDERAAAGHGERGQDEAHTGRERTAAEHVAGPRGGAPDGAVHVAPETTAAEGHLTGAAGDHRGPHSGGAQDGRGRSGAEQDGNSTAQYETPESVPSAEPVRHSRLVEERVQEQERDYDLGTTEEGERYLTPKDLPEA